MGASGSFPSVSFDERWNGEEGLGVPDRRCSRRAGSEVNAMGRVWTVGCLALAVALGWQPAVATKAPAPTKRTAVAAKASVAHDRGSVSASRQVRARVASAPRAYVAHAPRAYGMTRGRRTGFADLVGDPDSGYGFYLLPPEIRMGAARYRFVHRRFWWQNPVLAAMAADALRNPCWIPAGQYYRCGVFNPIDGVGTPFFAGYYR